MDKDTISRFIRHACTPEEELEVVRWLTNTRSKKELQEIIERDLLDGLGSGSATQTDLSAIRKRILARHAEHRPPQTAHRLWKLAMKAAASLLILAGLLFLILNHISHIEAPQQTEAAPKRVIKSNQKGRKSTIFLPDGSTVNLNSESMIGYPEGFSSARRVVYLVGEAFFEVAQNPDKPFVVKTHGLEIRALGTSFNVRAYKGTVSVKIALATGRVEVYERIPKTDRQKPNDTERSKSRPGEYVNRDNKAILLPGQSITFDNESHIFSMVESFDPREEFGWKEGIIYFKKADLQEVFSTLERWYNVEFLILNNPGHQWSHNGEYQNMTLRQVLQQMAFTEGIEYNINENHIRISFER